MNSVEAYDIANRVRRYDSDMDVMHPLRWKMINVVLELIPYRESQPLKIMDLGVGTGIFTKEILNKYPNSSVVAIDGAEKMIDLAKSRLGDRLSNVDWIVADFQSLPSSILQPDSYDIVISSYALHHLDAEEKQSVVKSTVNVLKPGGWFLNADLFVAGDEVIEDRFQEIRVKGVCDRADDEDVRLNSAAATRSFLDDLETAEQDKPLTLLEDLMIMKSSGIDKPEVIWKEYREAVIGGRNI